MVLYALLIIAVGVGIDLGWYYLTVSLLQNAADVAVLAGALKLVEKNQDLSDYYVYSLADHPTSDFNLIAQEFPRLFRRWNELRFFVDDMFFTTKRASWID